MQNRVGFTLIELLVVVLIIGILAAVAVPQYQVAVEKSRYTQLMVGADMIKKANQLYYMANGKYSVDLNDLDLSLVGCEIINDGRACKLKSGGTCYVNDGTTSGGELKAIVYCIKDGMYYSLRNENNNRYCYASSNNNVANKVCLSMGGVYESETLGHKTYRLP